jgi:hypothetical protein
MGGGLSSIWENMIKILSAMTSAYKAKAFIRQFSKYKHLNQDREIFHVAILKFLDFACLVTI